MPSNSTLSGATYFVFLLSTFSFSFPSTPAATCAANRLSISPCSRSSSLRAYSCPTCMPITPSTSNATRAFPAARTRTASTFSDSVAGVKRGGGVGRMEKEVVVCESGTGGLAQDED